jgi:hypothetical protein
MSNADFACGLCGKFFQSTFHLNRHKKRTTPCSGPKIIKEYNCKCCNIVFKYESEFKRHEQTKGHIAKYDVYINKVQIENFNVNIVGGIKTFSETCLNVLEHKDIERGLYSDSKLVLMLRDFKEDKDNIFGNSEYIVNSFKFFIKLFSKLNFNLAYTKNHNCAIYSFSKLDNNYIEYHLLEIDHINKQYTVDHIDYDKFIEAFLNLMIKINEQYKNEDFTILLNYVKKYNNLIYSEYTKQIIENTLYTEYNVFKEAKKNITQEEALFLKDRTEARANSLRNFLMNF